MSRAAVWFSAGVIALAIAASCQLDGPEDHQADWAESDAIKELQATEAGTARRQAAGQRVCLEARGPQSGARWLDDGSLVCTVRNGVRRASL